MLNSAPFHKMILALSRKSLLKLGSCDHLSTKIICGTSSGHKTHFYPSLYIKTSVWFFHTFSQISLKITFFCLSICTILFDFLVKGVEVHIYKCYCTIAYIAPSVASDGVFIEGAAAESHFATPGSADQIRSFTLLRYFSAWRSGDACEEGSVRWTFPF